MIPQLSDLLQTLHRIRPFVHCTPVLTSSSISRIASSASASVNIHFKCDNFQKVGAFKFRGASNAILSSHHLTAKGIATHSSGNHAAAIALAAQMQGVPSYVVMPRTAPKLKKAAVEGYGANIIFCDPTLQARETALAQVVGDTGAHFVHAYDDMRVIQGQATACMELLQYGWKHNVQFDMILVPVGGGGLLSGTALAAKYLSPGTRVIGCEPVKANDALLSFQTGNIVPAVQSPQTICDGLLTSLGKNNFEVIREFVDDIVTVEEESIVQAMRMIWERMKIIVEPSCAVTLAAILEKKDHLEKGKNKKDLQIGVILSGGNVDLDELPWRMSK